jgi:lambda family phage portal protein
MVRNNGHAQSAVRIIPDDTVGWGIRAAAKHEAWKVWADTTDIDAEGRCDLAGLEHLVMKTVMISGECLVRRRWRRLSDGLALPMQIEVSEPNLFDTSQHRLLPNGGKIIRGVEFDPLGRRAAYWLYRDPPSSSTSRLLPSVRVPASEVLHVFDQQRPKQVRGASWFASVLMKLSDFDEMSDATLMKQKVAACLAVLTSDVDGNTLPLGTVDPADAYNDQLGPGMILNLQPGRSVEVVQPPNVRDYEPYSKTTLNEIAAGLGVTPEDLTGDYSGMNFSSARMSRLRHWQRVEGWRWRMLTPQLLNPLWRWGMQAASLAGLPVVPMTTWTAPPLPMIEPDKEGLAIGRNIRTGISTPSEELRARGYVPEEFWDEYAADFAELDRRGIVVDSDARKMTQVGQIHPTAKT